MNTEHVNYGKGILITIWGVITSTLGVLAFPIVLMLVCNIIDYGTGMMAIPYRGETPKSYKHIHGLQKKIGMWVLVAVGAVIDGLLKYTTEQIGIELPFNYIFACVVCVWIICNEIMSILENLRDIGIKVPAFMYAPVEQMQDQIESMTQTKTDEMQTGSDDELHG